ncbi:MAG: hypothetical protein QM660_10675 [Dysgonomonas sp.]
MEKKNNSQESAFGFAAQLSREEDIYNHGLTKRELFAAMAMQGYITDPNSTPSRAAVFAVKCADALLAELNKGKEATDE